MSKQSGFLAKQAAIQQKMIDDAQRITCELMAGDPANYVARGIWLGL